MTDSSRRLQEQNEIRRILDSRRRNATRPDAHGDGVKLGLVVEGGGMRGVMSCAMVDALYQLGYGNCFDAVFGTSAGAINGSYFLSGQITIGTSIYYDNLVGNKFINFLHAPNIMDIHYLFDEWIKKGKALKVDKVLTSPAEFWICATDADTGNPAYFCNRNLSPDELIRALRASSSTPLFTNNTEWIRGHRYNDGLVNDGIPVFKAIEAGCTHLLCVLTRPVGYRKSKRYAVSILEALRLLNRNVGFRRAFDSRTEKYNQALDFIFRTSDERNFPVLPLAPLPEDFLVGNAERRRDRLLRAVRDSMRRVATDLNQQDVQLRLADGTAIS